VGQYHPTQFYGIGTGWRCHHPQFYEISMWGNTTPHNFAESERKVDAVPVSTQKKKPKKPDGVLQCSLTPAVELPEGSHAVFDMNDSPERSIKTIGAEESRLFPTFFLRDQHVGQWHPTQFCEIRTERQCHHPQFCGIKTIGMMTSPCQCKEETEKTGWCPAVQPHPCGGAAGRIPCGF